MATRCASRQASATDSSPPAAAIHCSAAAFLRLPEHPAFDDNVLPHHILHSGLSDEAARFSWASSPRRSDPQPSGYWRLACRA